MADDVLKEFQTLAKQFQATAQSARETADALSKVQPQLGSTSGGTATQATTPIYTEAPAYGAGTGGRMAGGAYGGDQPPPRPPRTPKYQEDEGGDDEEREAWGTRAHHGYRLARIWGRRLSRIADGVTAGAAMFDLMGGSESGTLRELAVLQQLKPAHKEPDVIGLQNPRLAARQEREFEFHKAERANEWAQRVEEGVVAGVWGLWNKKIKAAQAAVAVAPDAVSKTAAEVVLRKVETDFAAAITLAHAGGAAAMEAISTKGILEKRDYNAINLTEQMREMGMDKKHIDSFLTKHRGGYDEELAQYDLEQGQTSLKAAIAAVDLGNMAFATQHVQQAEKFAPSVTGQIWKDPARLYYQQEAGRIANRQFARACMTSPADRTGD